MKVLRTHSTHCLKTDFATQNSSDSAILEAIARRLIWWMSPPHAVSDQKRFIAQVMTYGNWEDVQDSLRILGESVFRETLADPPSGVFDGRSWTYWHHRFQMLPVPPLPTRKLG
jgi:hypothetical protein